MNCRVNPSRTRLRAWHLVSLVTLVPGSDIFRCPAQNLWLLENNRCQTDLRPTTQQDAFPKPHVVLLMWICFNQILSMYCIRLYLAKGVSYFFQRLCHGLYTEPRKRWEGRNKILTLKLRVLIYDRSYLAPRLQLRIPQCRSEEMIIKQWWMKSEGPRGHGCISLLETRLCMQEYAIFYIWRMSMGNGTLNKWILYENLF